jgi:UrcA family protein
MISRTLAFAALSAAMLSASAVPAMAADEPKTGSSMSYADLDLGTAAGRAELAQRFVQAAREKCGVTDEKAKGKGKYCYRTTSEQYRHYVADILRDHDAKKAEGLALR